MNKAVKEKWVKALRSGEYLQTSGQLCVQGGAKNDPDRFCCLGVLEDLYAIERGEDWVAEDHDAHTSPTCRAWSGLPQGHQGTLAFKNDKGRSFEELADYIEKYC